VVRNVDLAEELAQDALVVAPSEWPKTGVPVNPGAWLMGTLRAVGRLTTDEIARAFLSSEATIAERIVRAKKVIAKAGLTFEAPSGRRGCPRCSRSSTSFSMKAIRPRRATTLSGRACAWRHNGSAACWPG
jgi:predicted RNA polymerase sigma factor